MAIDTVDLGVPHLTLVDTIGRGGFSVVYRALDTKLNRPVAVKVLTAGVSQDDLDRFDSECRIHGPLSTHPNIVSIHDAGFTPTGSPYLVMEYLDRGTLHDRLERQGPMNWREAVDSIIAICNAVQAAHDAGVLHRDIKPANILLSPDGPKLADFGIACVSDATSPQFAVSWQHAPPEAERNQRDERSDVYSLGSTLFQLLTAQAPFWRDGDQSLAGLLGRVVTEPAPHLAPGVAPPAIDAVLQRALAKDPALRPPSAAALRTELEAAMIQRPSPIVPVAAAAIPTLATAPTTIIGQPLHHATTPAAAPASAPARKRQSRLLPALAAVLTLATLGLAVSPALSRLSEPGATPASTSTSSTTEPTPSTETSTTDTTDPSTTTSTSTASSSATETTTPSSTTSSTSTSTSTTSTSTSTSTTTTEPEPPPVVLHEVPHVVGLSRTDATDALSAIGFTDVTVVEVTSEAVATGLVIATDPTAGALLEAHTPITVRVSDGPAPVAVPDVIGLPRNAAELALTDAGFTPVTATQFVESGSPLIGTVTAVDPAGGSLLAPGSDVTITVAVELVIVNPGPIEPVQPIDPIIVPNP